jgi:hypothetical protein
MPKLRRPRQPFPPSARLWGTHAGSSSASQPPPLVDGSSADFKSRDVEAAQAGDLGAALQAFSQVDRTAPEGAEPWPQGVAVRRLSAACRLGLSGPARGASARGALAALPPRGNAVVKSDIEQATCSHATQLCGSVTLGRRRAQSWHARSALRRAPGALLRHAYPRSQTRGSTLAAYMTGVMSSSRCAMAAPPQVMCSPRTRSAQALAVGSSGTRLTMACGARRAYGGGHAGVGGGLSLARPVHTYPMVVYRLIIAGSTSHAPGPVFQHCLHPSLPPSCRHTFVPAQQCSSLHAPEHRVRRRAP